jgi:glycosyltransferase involved in cell wall biosynthesis
MSKLALVIPWFGRDLKGGAELHAWHLATRLALRGHTVEVITTCCRSHAHDWAANYHVPGQSREPEGFTISRFAVEPRNKIAFDACNHRILAVDRSRLIPGVSPVNSTDELTFVNELIRSPTLLNYIAEKKGIYNAVLFLPYLYGLIVQGVHLVPDRAILIPCLHDEAYAYLPEVAKSIFAAKRLLYLSEGERELALRIFGPGIALKGIVAGAGVEMDAAQGRDDSILSNIGSDKFVLCLGRKAPGKKTDFLANCFRTYKNAHRESLLRLVIAGPGNVDLPTDCPGLVELGVVSESQKRSLLETCLALFHPSDNESYSRVIMEAWMCGRPAAASAECLATSSAVSAGGGWLASSEADWVSLFATIDNIDHDSLDAMGDLGYHHALENASWDNAITRYEQALVDVQEIRESGKLAPCPSSRRPIHQLLPHLLYGDAISNQAIWIKEELQAAGFQTQIFCLGIDPKLSNLASLWDAALLSADDSLIYHHSIGSEITAAAVAHTGARCLIYHNITPHKLLEPYLPSHARLCFEGRMDLPSLASAFQHSAGDSRFNASELTEAGFANPRVLPICVNPAKWMMPPDPSLMRRLSDGRTNVLFVGRISPHKKQEDLIYAFSKLREMDHTARLILVGAPLTTNDLYFACLKQFSDELGITDSVEFAGRVSDPELAAYYRCAHLFWSMSEHEGFCVPLIEAMWFDVPVYAFSGSAVTETLGSSGVLFSSKDDMMILATQALDLARNAPIRRKVIDSQRRRRSEFLPEAVGAHLNELIQEMLKCSLDR